MSRPHSSNNTLQGALSALFPPRSAATSSWSPLQSNSPCAARSFSLRAADTYLQQRWGVQWIIQRVYLGLPSSSRGSTERRRRNKLGRKGQRRCGFLETSVLRHRGTCWLAHSQTGSRFTIRRSIPPFSNVSTSLKIGPRRIIAAKVTILGQNNGVRDKRFVCL